MNACPRENIRIFVRVTICSRERLRTLVRGNACPRKRRGVHEVLNACPLGNVGVYERASGHHVFQRAFMRPLASKSRNSLLIRARSGFRPMPFRIDLHCLKLLLS